MKSEDATVSCDLSMSTLNTDPAGLLGMSHTINFDRSLMASFGASLDLDRHITSQRTRGARTDDDSDMFGESFAVEDATPVLQRKTSRGLGPNAVLNEESSENEEDEEEADKQEQAIMQERTTVTAAQN